MTSSNRTWRTLAVALRIAVGVVFAYAALAKMYRFEFVGHSLRVEKLHWIVFAGAIGDYKVLPDWAVVPLARSLPWVELVIGVMLIAGLGTRIAATACSVLLAGFFGLMVRAQILHMNISCGCFGPTGDIISWRTLLRDGTLLAASLIVTWTSFARRKPLPGKW
ncbi:MAG: DoxX family membrane protein [Acidobacteriia bacterium]|nr:DoxX family membrane protein [Terriglobia bacterium]